MGKQRVPVSFFITAVFSAFLFGFFFGRNYNHSEIQISRSVMSAKTTISTEAILEGSTATTPTETEAATEYTAVTEAPLESTAPTESIPTAEATEMAAVAATESAKDTTATETAKSTQSAAVSSGLININTATAAQLETLPGIGEVLAQRIVDYRNTYGPFKSVYALTNVKGIGEKRLAAVINLITV